MAGRIDKGQNFRHQRICAEGRAHVFQTLGEHRLATKQRLKRAMQQFNLWLVETPPLQADDIQPREVGSVAEDAAERNDVAFNPRHAADHCRASDSHELMDRGAAADDRVIADADMTAHQNVVGDRNVIAQRAIVRHVRHRHDHAIRSNRGHALAGRGAAMNGAMLSYLGSRADLATCRFALVFKILRRHADRAKGKQFCIRPDPRMSIDRDVGDEFDPILQHDVGANGAEWPDGYADAQLGGQADHGGGMDGDAGFASHG